MVSVTVRAKTCNEGILNFQPTTKLFIDGKFIESKTSEWLDIHNPVSIRSNSVSMKNFSSALVF